MGSLLGSFFLIRVPYCIGNIENYPYTFQTSTPHARPLKGPARSVRRATVDDINPVLLLRTKNYGNEGILLMMGSAGFVSSTVLQRPEHVAIPVPRASIIGLVEYTPPLALTLFHL